MAYAIGHISGCHLNPPVSVGLWAGDRFPANQLLPYISVQVVGDWAVSQLWLFWLAPIVGAVIGAQIYRFVNGGRD